MPAVRGRPAPLSAVTVTAGLSDLVLRDAGVLGQAICLTGVTQQRLALRR